MKAEVRHHVRCDEFISEKLIGKLWHVTRQDRFDRIIGDGAIRHEPDIPDTDRWSTRAGPDWYPFVRSIGGFSLFDFPVGFDINDYRLRCVSSMLEAFIPFPPSWGNALWLEIDQDKQQRSLLSGAAVWERSQREGHGKRCMPHIEAAHIGDMPVASILSAYKIGQGDADWQPINL